MRTTINGSEAEWTPEIHAAWAEALAYLKRLDPRSPLPIVVSCNYFTPRPFVDEWNRGSKDRGFVYVTDTRAVGQVLMTRHVAAADAGRPVASEGRSGHTKRDVKREGSRT